MKTVTRNRFLIEGQIAPGSPHRIGVRLIKVGVSRVKIVLACGLAVLLTGCIKRYSVAEPPVPASAT